MRLLPKPFGCRTETNSRRKEVSNKRRECKELQEQVRNLENSNDPRKKKERRKWKG
jgi:hypothetical protein